MSISIQPLSQYFVEAPLAAITSSSLLGYVYQLFTSGFGDFVPFFLVDLLKPCQVGWGVSVNSNLQVFPQILNGIQVWALAEPLKDFHILVLKTFKCCFGCMLGVIVLLEHKTLPVSGLLHSKAGSPQGFARIWLHSLFPLSLKVSQSLPMKSISIA